jgi:hypothetical protein
VPELLSGAWVALRRTLPLAAVLVAALAAAAPAGASVHVRWTDLNDAPGVVDPQFSWDPIPRAVKYEVEVNSSNDWAVGSRVCCDDSAIGTSLSPVKLLPNNTYYWRVRAFFAGGDAGDWHVWCGNAVPECPDPGTLPLGFDKTFDDVVPTVPKLHVRDSTGDTTPLGGGPVLGLPTTDKPVLAWDPVPGASSYELKLAPYDVLGGFCNWTSTLGPTFTTAATAWTPLAPAGASSPVGNAHLGVTSGAPLQNGVTYCVRARARSDRDAKGAEIVSDWTQIGGLGRPAFTYQTVALPPCHATAMPAAAYHDEPSKTVAALRMPLFTWDRVDGACGYFIVIAKDPAFTKVLDVAYTTVPAYAPRLGALPMTYPDETTSYYWAVMPSASATGDGVSTQPQEDNPQPFNKRSVPPTLVSPREGVTGEPSFRWTATEAARDYRLQVDDDPNFGTPITNIVTNSTAYTSLSKYPASKDLYWRVRANDETNVGLGWSEVGTFSALPPETYIDSGPDLKGSTAAFTFSSDLPDAAFKCRLDGPGTKVGSAIACTSPMSYPSLADGAYTFTVTAADLAGNADPTPATRTFTVDTTPPDTTISSAPGGSIASSSASFSFTATQAGSRFECKLDGPGATTGTWTTCPSPSHYDGLADGGYAFSVRAIDAAGNTDPTPATAGFNVDTTAPETVISSGPVSTRPVEPTVGFVFSASEPGSALECRLEAPGGANDWTPCDSPTTYSDLGAGAHRFLVRATDAAGNTDPSPATWTFSVAAHSPQDTPAQPPAGSSPSPSSGFTPGLAAPAVQPAASPPPPRRGTPTFLTPRRPLRVRAGVARLRFRCGDPDGCTVRLFSLRGRGLRLTVIVPGRGSGTEVVAARLGRTATRVLRRAGRRGVKVTLRAADGGPASRFRLVRAR